MISEELANFFAVYESGQTQIFVRSSGWKRTLETAFVVSKLLHPYFEATGRVYHAKCVLLPVQRMEELLEKMDSIN